VRLPCRGGLFSTLEEAAGLQGRRPKLATAELVIITIVANNYILYPYLSIFTDKVRVLDLPDRLWQLMEIGVGVYILGRTAEKVKGGSEVM